MPPHRAEWDRLCREAGDFKYYSVTLQPSPMGDLMIQAFVFENPAAVRQSFTDSPHDKWWTGFIKDVTGFDITGTVPAPPTPAFVWQG